MAQSLLLEMAPRLWSKALADGTGCWVWQAGKTEGYGSIGVPCTRKSMYAHRVAYQLVRGPIPEGLVIDHLCRVRACINPSHMEVVTNRENILRGESPSAIDARKTHCKRGHLFDEQNTYIRYNGSRLCRTCNRERHPATPPAEVAE